MTCLPYYKVIQYPVNIIFFLLNFTCSVFSVSGNSLTIFVVITKSSLHSPTNWLLAALSLTDLLVGLIVQPLYGIYLAFAQRHNNCVLEKSIVFISAASCTASLGFLCAIARDRYLHVAKGLDYQQYTNKKQVSIITTTTTAIIIIITIIITNI